MWLEKPIMVTTDHSAINILWHKDGRYALLVFDIHEGTSMCFGTSYKIFKDQANLQNIEYEDMPKLLETFFSNGIDDIEPQASSSIPEPSLYDRITKWLFH